MLSELSSGYVLLHMCKQTKHWLMWRRTEYRWILWEMKCFRQKQNICINKLWCLKNVLPAILREGRRVKYQSKSQTTSIAKRRDAVKALPISNAIRFVEAQLWSWTDRMRRGEEIGRELKPPFERGPLIAAQRKLLSGNFGHSKPAKCCDTGQTVNTVGLLSRGALPMADLLTPFRKTLRRRFSKAANRFVSSQWFRGLTSRSFLLGRGSREVFCFISSNLKYSQDLRETISIDVVCSMIPFCESFLRNLFELRIESIHLIQWNIKSTFTIYARVADISCNFWAKYHDIHFTVLLQKSSYIYFIEWIFYCFNFSVF